MVYKLLILFLLIAVADASAQSIDPDGITVAEADKGFLERVAIESRVQSAPLGVKITLSDYNESLPVTGWIGTSIWGPYALFGWGQSFTLPASESHIDSVRIRFLAAKGDSIVVIISHDTVREVVDNSYHLINLQRFDYAIKRVAIASIAPDGWLTVPFTNVRVDRDFIVYVQPYTNTAAQTVSSFTLAGDIQPAHNSTTESARSTWIGVDQGQVIHQGPIDGFLTPSGWDSVAYSDLYIEVYADVASGSVDHGPSSPQPSIYPNPVIAGGMLRVNHTKAISQIRIVNALGAEVSNWSGVSSNVELPIARIPSGVYHLLITTASGVTNEKIVVQ